MRKEFRLPDVGEGLTEAEIVSWKVQPGDTIKVNDVVVEIETAKSIVELPTPYAGVVAELLVEPGTTVAVGTPIIAVVDPSDARDASGAGGSGEGGRAEPVAAQPVPEAAAAPEERIAVLVGYGVRTGVPTGRRRRQSARVKEDGAATPPAPTTAAAPAGPAFLIRTRPLAKPPVRRLARDLGVDLASVVPSGPGGVVTRADVKAAAHGDETARPVPAGLVEPVAGQRETRTPMKGVRLRTAEAMVASAFTAPHVTEWVQVDVTRSVKLLDRLRADRRFEGVKLSPLVLVAAAVLVAVRRNPGVNAVLDETVGERGEIVTKHYVNLGIAAATPRGLLVPVIRDADRLGLRELAEAITALAETARAGRTQPDEMSGGTFTITNVGVFGVDGGTPIITPGQSAILAVGQVAQRAWVHKGKVKPRWVTELTLSFDHRIIDGDLGSRFLADVAAVLADPASALT